MGYDLHITRKAQWSDEDGPEISPQEWREVVRKDMDLSEDPESQIDLPEGPTTGVLWRGSDGVLWYQDGGDLRQEPRRAADPQDGPDR